MGLLDGTAEPEKLIETCKELALREGPRVGWGVWGIIKVCVLFGYASIDYSREWARLAATACTTTPI